MNREDLIDLDNHMRILNFLIYLQSIAVLSETERIDYSNYIQNYLKSKKENIDVINQCLSLIVNSK